MWLPLSLVLSQQADSCSTAAYLEPQELVAGSAAVKALICEPQHVLGFIEAFNPQAEDRLGKLQREHLFIRQPCLGSHLDQFGQ